jgi:hypothetical protein
MTQAEIKKIAADYENAKPVPVWSDLDDLTDTRVEVVVEGKKKSLNFEKAVELYKELDGKVEVLEKLKKEIKDGLQPALLVAGVEKVMAAGRPVTLVTKKGSKKIVVEKLMEQGVSPIVIAKATEIGKDSQYLMIGKAKGEREF